MKVQERNACQFRSFGAVGSLSLSLSLSLSISLSLSLSSTLFAVLTKHTHSTITARGCVSFFSSVASRKTHGLRSSIDVQQQPVDFDRVRISVGPGKACMRILITSRHCRIYLSRSEPLHTKSDQHQDGGWVGWWWGGGGGVIISHFDSLTTRDKQILPLTYRDGKTRNSCSNSSQFCLFTNYM